MMAFFRKIKETTKNQPADIWFFLLFLLTFTLSIRKVLFYFPIQGTFNEYSGIYLYLSDIFLLLAISVWLFTILYNNIVNLSNIKLWISYAVRQKLIFLPFLLVAWSFVSILWSQKEIIAIFRSVKFLEFYLLYIYIIFRIFPQCKNLKFSTFTPLTPNVPRGTFGVFTGWNILALTIIFVATIHSSIGIVQFISQESIGLTFFKESILRKNAPGVAKIVFDGEKYIRAYGLFPHPNIFGGFLLLPIAITFLFLKLFHVEQFQGRLKIKQSLPFFSQIDRKNYSKNTEDQIFDAHTEINNFTNIVPRGTITFFSLKMILITFLFIMFLDHYLWDIQQGSFMLWIVFGLISGMNMKSPNCSIWNNLEPRSKPEITTQEQVSPNKPFDFFPEKYPSLIKRTLKIVLTIQILALVLTFSKSAIAGLIVALSFNTCVIIPKCSTWNILGFFRLSHSKSKKIIFGLVFAVVATFFLSKQLSFEYFLLQPIRERLQYLSVSHGTITSSPILGVGSGQTVLLSQHFSQKVLDPYEYQPVHNVFLLIWSELGIVGLVLFFLFLKELFHVKQSRNINCSTPARR